MPTSEGSAAGASLPLAGVDAVVLVGGLGTRLRGVVDGIPKPLAPVAGRPFLFYLLDRIALRGARSVTLCCAYEAEAVRRAVGPDWLGMPVRCLVEDPPAGTGGALLLAAAGPLSEVFVAMNGDSWFEPDWAGLLAGAELGACLALAEVADCSRFGAVDFEGGLVTGFGEKGREGPGVINAGVYALKRQRILATTGHSIEREIFPELAAARCLAGVVGRGPFLDIGVPESYAAAAGFFDGLGLRPTGMFPDAATAVEGAQVKLGTCTVIFDDAGRVLLERRADCGWWCLPGGRLDPGERVLEGAIREAVEETGLEVEVERFLGLFSDPRRRTVRYPDNGDLRHLIDAAVVARPVGGALAHGPESTDLRWFAPDHIPLDTVPPVIEILREAYASDHAPRLR